MPIAPKNKGHKGRTWCGAASSAGSDVRERGDILGDSNAKEAPTRTRFARGYRDRGRRESRCRGDGEEDEHDEEEQKILKLREFLHKKPKIEGVRISV
jgi:hypothetical protein